MKLFKRIILISACTILVYSVARSGLGYMYDADEVARVQESYLIATGTMPYRDYYTIYSPIFPIFLIPILMKEGFTFAAIDAARFFMVIVFFIRVGVVALVATKLFNKRVGILCTALFLLDPFTVFSAMQVRPDNLMMTLVAFGVLILVDSMKTVSRRRVAVASGILALSVCVMIKALPTVIIVSGWYMFFAWKQRAYTQIKYYISGAVIVVAMYLTPFALTGTLGLMIQQSILDPKAFQTTQDYPTNIGFFYGPGNAYVYGLGGKPLNWMYAWILPILGFTGAYQIVLAAIQNQGKDRKLVVGSALAVSLAAQWGLLLTLHTVLIQYYLPSMWLFAMFGAYGIDKLITELDTMKVRTRGNFGNVGLMVIMVIFFILGRESFTANMNRSKLGSDDFVALMNRIWSYVPPDVQVFPMTLFRPPAYPLAEGYFAGVHSGLLSRYRPVEAYLEEKDVPFINASDYTIGYLPAATQAYIRNQYVKVEAGLDLMVRKGYEGLVQKGVAQ